MTLKRSSRKSHLFANRICKDLRKWQGRLAKQWYTGFSFVASRLFGKPLVHVIGDSHAGVFDGKKYFQVHTVGSATAYNLTNENSSTQSGRRIFNILNDIKRQDIVVFSFGEIDCRIHIYNQFKKHDQQIPISTLIERTISNYRDLLRKVSTINLTFCVYGVPPAGTQENNYGYPFYGDRLTRASIHREFNEALKKMCADSGYRFIDIYPLVVGAEGLIAPEFAAADGVHLNSNVVGFVKTWLKRHLEIRV